MRNYQTFSIYFALCIAGLLPQDVHAFDHTIMGMSVGAFFGVFFGSFILLVALLVFIGYLCKRAGCECEGGVEGGDTYTFSQGIPLS